MKKRPKRALLARSEVKETPRLLPKLKRKVQKNWMPHFCREGNRTGPETNPKFYITRKKLRDSSKKRQQVLAVLRLC